MPTKAIKQKLQDRYIKWAIVVLITIGVVAVATRLLFTEKSKLPGSDTVWTISIEAQVTNSLPGDRISMSPPWNNPTTRVVSQNLQYTGLRQVRLKGDAPQKRNIVLQVTNPGDLSIYTEFNIHVRTTPQIDFSPVARPLDTKRRALYLSSEDNIDLASPRITSVLEKISGSTTSNEEIVKNIFNYTNTKIVKIIHDKNDTAESALLNNRATTLGRSRAMVGLCRAIGIPARIVSGFILEDAIEASPHYWVEVYMDNAWASYDPEKGYMLELPANFVAFSRGSSEIVSSSNMEKFRASYSIEQNFDLADLNIITDSKPTDIFNLNRFSPETRQNLGLLLLLPLGTLITAFCRNIIGIRAYGTFTPTLLALAAVYADWVAAIVLLAIVVAMGLSGRSAMPDKITRIPRLAIMFTIVIMSMVIGVSLMEYFRVNPGEHVILLPIVILTTLIDRFYSTADENGAYIAIRRMIWTVIIGILCYPVLKLEAVGSQILTYPEIHFVTLAIILAISTYKGRQLADFSIFSWIREPKKPKEKTNGDSSPE